MQADERAGETIPFIDQVEIADAAAGMLMVLLARAVGCGDSGDRGEAPEAKTPVRLAPGGLPGGGGAGIFAGVAQAENRFALDAAPEFGQGRLRRQVEALKAGGTPPAPASLDANSLKSR